MQQQANTTNTDQKVQLRIKCNGNDAEVETLLSNKVSESEVFFHFQTCGLCGC